MKLSNLAIPLFVIVAIVASRKADHGVAPEKKIPPSVSSRTLATAGSPAIALGVVERDGCRYVVGENGPIAVPRGTAPLVLFSFLRPRIGVEIDAALGPFSLGLVDDPHDLALALVVVAEEPMPPPIVGPHSQASQP